MLPTTMPSPRSLNFDQTCGALMWSTPHSTVFGVPLPGARRIRWDPEDDVREDLRDLGARGERLENRAAALTRIAFRIQKT